MPLFCCPVGEHCCVMCLQVIHKHFYLKRTEIMSQCEEWIADIQQYSSDKRVGRTMSHHAAALKVMSLYVLNILIMHNSQYYEVSYRISGPFWGLFQSERSNITVDSLKHCDVCHDVSKCIFAMKLLGQVKMQMISC